MKGIRVVIRVIIFPSPIPLEFSNQFSKIWQLKGGGGDRSWYPRRKNAKLLEYLSIDYASCSDKMRGEVGKLRLEIISRYLH